MVAEDVCIVVFCRGNALLLLQLAGGDEQVAVLCRQLKLFGSRCIFHALAQRLFQLRWAAFKEHLRVTPGFTIGLRRSQALNAGSKAALNVVLKARTRMVAGKIDLAAWDHEAAVDDFGDPVGEVSWKIRAIVSAAVFPQASGDEYLRKSIPQRQLDIRIGLVVAQQ